MNKLLLAGACAAVLGLAACGGNDEANNMDATLNDELNMDMNADMNMDMNADNMMMGNEAVDNTTTNTGY
ncbi:MAG TPA: hypothetical protein VFZ35_00995 [Sphingomicrobium sp.]